MLQKGSAFLAKLTLFVPLSAGMKSYQDINSRFWRLYDSIFHRLGLILMQHRGSYRFKDYLFGIHTRRAIIQLVAIIPKRYWIPAPRLRIRAPYYPINFSIFTALTLYSGILARGSKASASVLTKTDCVIYFLSKDNFQKLNLESPGKAAELHTYIIKLLSDRLAKSNATIQALMR